MIAHTGSGPACRAVSACRLARAADNGSVRNFVMQTLTGVLIDQQRIHELVYPAYVGQADSAVRSPRCAAGRSSPMTPVSHPYGLP